MLWDFVLWDFVSLDFVRRDCVLWDFVPDSRRKLSFFDFGDTIRDGGWELVKCVVLAKVHGKIGSAGS